ncbi:hypothetical protein [Xanthomonas euvesicatoria]|uniref:hypothetical protein n=1 Tax=Xanthomonas euvesicatoria TaxID=456327 RepID=UPI001C43A66A|nr:hypothetical protein [Xanthomonas euvesicatoria]MBV6896551.1 hypothetical protein [Xanthomonas campestris pv. ionidii]
MARKAVKKAAKKIVRKVAKKAKGSPKETGSLLARFPRHAVGKCIRIAKAIFEQNAGHPCTPAEAAAFVGVGLNGPFNVEISSASKFGLLERPTTGQIQPTQLAKK